MRKRGSRADPAGPGGDLDYHGLVGYEQDLERYRGSETPSAEPDGPVV